VAGGTAGATGGATSGGGTSSAAAAAAGGRAAAAKGAAAAAAGGGGAGDTTGVTNDSVTIGIHAPVTGAAPFPATAFSKGKDVYANFINGKGGINGRNVKIVFEDDGYNPSQAVAVCKKMVEQDHVFMLVGGGGTDQIVACAQYAAKVGVPYEAEGVGEQALSGLSNYFAISMTYKAQAFLLAQYMKNVLHVTKVGMIRGNTANFDDAHSGFLQAAQQNGLQVVKDIVIDKNADSGTAFTAGGQICSDRTNPPQAVYPLIAPKIWIQIVAGAHAQACEPTWSGVGVTEGLNTVAAGICGADTTAKAHFFSPFPGIDREDAVDPDFKPAYDKQNGSANRADEYDIGFDLWGAEQLIAAQLAAPGRNLSRQSFIAASAGHSFSTKVYPPVNYAASRFGGTQVHVLQLDCSKQQYTTEQMNKSSF